MKIIWLYAPRTPEKGKQLIDILASNFDIRHQCSGKKKRANQLGSTGELRREIVVLNCLAPKGAQKRKDLQLDLHALACRLAAQLKARSAPGQDSRSGHGALARRHTDGPLWAALLKTTVMCKAWRRCTGSTLLGSLSGLPATSATSPLPGDASKKHAGIGTLLIPSRSRCLE
jgi:hypothetical protein